MDTARRSGSLAAVLFDLDGTLVDTIPLIVSSFNAAVGPLVGRGFTLAEVISRFGVPDTEMVRRELAGAGLAELAEEAVEAYHAHYDAAHDGVEVFDGVAEMLEAVGRLGLPMGVMTGKGRRAADITLRRLGWTGRFGAVVTGDEAIKQKPAPDALWQVMRELGVSDPSACAFVGDSPADMKAGRAAGMTTVAAAWHAVYLDRIRPLAPDVWAEHPAEVVAWLEARGWGGGEARLEKGL